MSDNQSSGRREFLARSSALAAAGSITASLGALPAVHAQGSEAVNVALIGCGGRGTGAAVNAMRADPNNRLTVLRDLFPDQIERLKQTPGRQVGPPVPVTGDTTLTGF